MGLFDRFKNKENADSQKQEDFLDRMFKDSFLLNEAKFRHQQLSVKRSTTDEPITLEYILRELLDINPAEIGSMTIVNRYESGQNGETQLIEEASDVLAYKPYDAIMFTDSEGELRPITGKNTVLIISYRPAHIVYGDKEHRDDKSILGCDNSIIMFLRGMGPFMLETAYMRVSVMIPNFSQPDDFRITNSKNTPYTTSFILGLDMTPAEQRLKLYDSVEQSLLNKSKRDVEFSEDEKRVFEGITGRSQNDYSYGRWLVSEKRFADALMYLLRVFNDVKKLVVQKSDYQEIFADICFCIGFCYNELNQFDKATYYLELAVAGDNIKYEIEYINALVNGKDPRALSCVGHYLSEYKNGDRTSNTEESADFYCFLCRRLAYLYIEYEMWNDARELLDYLKTIPACQDFAEQELEYLECVSNTKN